MVYKNTNKASGECPNIAIAVETVDFESLDIYVYKCVYIQQTDIYACIYTIDRFICVYIYNRQACMCEYIQKTGIYACI